MSQVVQILKAMIRSELGCRLSVVGLVKSFVCAKNENKILREKYQKTFYQTDNQQPTTGGR